MKSVKNTIAIIECDVIGKIRLSNGMAYELFFDAAGNRIIRIFVTQICRPMCQQITTQISS
jgi:hypothetical protein